MGQEKEELKKLREEISDCQKLLNGYIRYLKKAKKNLMSKENEAVYESLPNNL